MKVDYYRWRIPQKPPKKPRLTSYFMTLEEGRDRYPEGEPALEWKEVREVADPGKKDLGLSSPPMPP